MAETMLDVMVRDAAGGCGSGVGGHSRARLPKFGWQQKVVGQEVHLPRLTEPERVMMRLQHGPLVSSALTGCGRQLDSLGHHRAGCSEAGVLGKKGVST